MTLTVTPLPACLKAGYPMFLFPSWKSDHPGIPAAADTPLASACGSAVVNHSMTVSCRNGEHWLFRFFHPSSILADFSLVRCRRCPWQFFHQHPELSPLWLWMLESCLVFRHLATSVTSSRGGISTKMQCPLLVSGRQEYGRSLAQLFPCGC